MANQFSAQQQQELVNGISQALQQGISPQEIVQTLVKMGIPQEQAVGVLQQIMQQMQGGASQQQAAMRYGGIPRAAMGMQMSPEFGTGMIQTMPNVQSFPSYNSYKTAYNQYIDQLGAAMQTTIPDLSGMGGEDAGSTLDVISQEEYDKIMKDNPEMVISIPTPVAPGDSDKNVIISTAVENMEPEEEVKQKIQNLENPTNNSSAWGPLDYIGIGSVGLVGAVGGGYYGYKGYKGLQRRFGKVPEINLSNLTPKEREAFMKTVDAVKARITQQGYYTKKDINDLVSNGIPRQEAEAFVEGMLTKKEKKSANRKAGQPGGPGAPDNSADVEAARQQRQAESLQMAKDEVTGWGKKYADILADPNASVAEKELAKKYFEDPVKFFQSAVATNPTDQLYIDALDQHVAAAREGFLPTAPTIVGPVYPGYMPAPTVVTPEQLGQTKEYLQAKAQARAGDNAALNALNAARAVQQGDLRLVIPGQSYTPKKAGVPARPSGKKFERQKMRGRQVVIPESIIDVVGGGKYKGKVKVDYGKMKRNPRVKLKGGGEYSDTYSAGVFYNMGGYVPEYAASAYGVRDLPQFEMGSYYDDDTYAYMPSQEELAAAQMMYGNPFAPSPLAKFVYPQTYADGGAAMGMSPEEQQMMMMQQQEAAQQPQGAGGGQEEQIIQAVAEMIQQGAQPQEILQQLVQAGVPQEMAVQVIQMVMEQMQGGAQQMTPEQAPPMPMQKYGGSKKRNSMVGREMDVTPQQMEELRRKGVKFEII
jgi:hypothetical protein